MRYTSMTTPRASVKWLQHVTCFKSSFASFHPRHETKKGQNIVKLRNFLHFIFKETIDVRLLSLFSLLIAGSWSTDSTRAFKLKFWCNILGEKKSSLMLWDIYYVRKRRISRCLAKKVWPEASNHDPMWCVVPRVISLYWRGCTEYIFIFRTLYFHRRATNLYRSYFRDVRTM